jgi:hypothetical protein
LPINKSCEKYIGFESPEDRVFWRGDLFVVRYEGELGMGHKYVDVSIALTGTIEDVIRRAYQNRRLESILENEEKLELSMEQHRK